MRKLKFQKSPALETLFYQFTHLSLGGKEVKCPYWMNRIGKKIFGPFGGKGTPRQICRVASYWSKKEQLDLNQLSAREIGNFMKRKKIGIDCSGFVYRMLSVLAKEKGVKSFRGKILGMKGKVGARHVNADSLTNEINTVLVSKVGEIIVGDLIRLKQGRHVAIVVKAVPRQLIYAHSTYGAGPHLGKIQILDPNQGLDSQIWLEKTRKGENYGKKYFYPQKGDGVRRLKMWG